MKTLQENNYTGFEQRLMEKYPSLFNKNEEGNTLPSECGIGAPEEWKDIIDSLCGSIVEYTAGTKSVKTKKPFVLFKYFLHKRIWQPIHYILMDVANPYRPYRPKGGWKGVIPPDIQKKIDQSKRTKIQSVLQRFTYKTIYPNDAWVTVPACDPVKIAQVKSKFGSLRFYIDGGDDAVHGMIRFAEYLCDQKTKGTKI
jgi:hypothetical protein